MAGAGVLTIKFIGLERMRFNDKSSHEQVNMTVCDVQ